MSETTELLRKQAPSLKRALDYAWTNIKFWEAITPEMVREALLSQGVPAKAADRYAKEYGEEQADLVAAYRQLRDAADALYQRIKRLSFIVEAHRKAKAGAFDPTR